MSGESESRGGASMIWFWALLVATCWLFVQVLEVHTHACRIGFLSAHTAMDTLKVIHAADCRYVLTVSK